MPSDWKTFVIPYPENLIPEREPQGIYSYGPEELRLRENVVIGGGPDEFTMNNPGLFATGTTSSYEGYAYWALMKLIGPAGEPGKNGAIWFYQSQVSPFGRSGSAVVDFVVDGVLEGWSIGIRIVSYFHTDFGSVKAALDFEQQSFLIDQGIYPVDADGEEMVSDPSGQTALILMQEAISVIPDLSSVY